MTFLNSIVIILKTTQHSTSQRSWENIIFLQYMYLHIFYKNFINFSLRIILEKLFYFSTVDQTVSCKCVHFIINGFFYFEQRKEGQYIGVYIDQCRNELNLALT